MRNLEMVSGKEAYRDRDDSFVMRKGPWMAEEDEILLDYVNKYGPRDWSSIRSKGLLPRTGKSCRLRWVNKLKPDLKSGCKFSPEEERVVIELQAQYGNKWARIATYLPGRTDNDVKNFWSMRQKRLARKLQSATTQKSQRNHGKFLVCREVTDFEAPLPNPIMFKENVINMVHLPDLISRNQLNLGTVIPPLEIMPIQQIQCIDPPQIPTPLEFSIPELRQPLLDLALLPGNQDIDCGLLESSYLDVFASQEAESCNGMSFGIELPMLELEAGEGGVRPEDEHPLTPDSFFDDFPTDMFDYLDSLPG